MVLFLYEELSTVNGTSLTAVSLSYMGDVSCERRCLLEYEDSKCPMLTLVTSQESDTWDRYSTDFSALYCFFW